MCLFHVEVHVTFRSLRDHRIALNFWKEDAIELTLKQSQLSSYMRESTIPTLTCTNSLRSYHGQKLFVVLT